MASIEPLKPLNDDGLPILEIGAWGEEKYRHVQLYASLFIKSMRIKWDALVYLDLFAGPGRSSIRGTRRIVSASPLLILGMLEAFDKYIFCEGNKNYTEALETRCRRDFPNRKVAIILGDANASTDSIIAEMPRPGRSRKVLGFCFLDPFHILLATRIGVLAGTRKRCPANHWNILSLRFGRAMRGLGYIDPGIKEAILIRSDEKNLPLYRLALYSRHKLGPKFWKETRKYSDPQTGFRLL